MAWYALATYKTDSGERSAICVADRIFDLAQASEGTVSGSVTELLRNWNDVRSALGKLAGDLNAAVEKGEAVPGLIEGAKLSRPFEPRRIFAAASNFAEHADEMKTKLSAKAESEPFIFLKTSESTIGPDDTITVPPRVAKPDWEVELGVVIGSAGKDIPAERALDHIAGYTIVNDVSARDQTRRKDFPFSHDWFRGKSYDGFTPIGPWFVPRECLGDPHDIPLGLKVNDVVRQNGNTAEMIFNTFEQIAYLSTICELLPGDLIATGTPAGVGMGSGIFLEDGDVMTAWVEGIGELRNPVTLAAGGGE
jgi:2-keto-4-pentenoate hydratase/2-oxohepta-3-ene-1,7-dioic acid hydratase in catechol pathway